MSLDISGILGISNKKNFNIYLSQNLKSQEVPSKQVGHCQWIVCFGTTTWGFFSAPRYAKEQLSATARGATAFGAAKRWHSEADIHRLGPGAVKIGTPISTVNMRHSILVGSGDLKHNLDEFQP